MVTGSNPVGELFSFAVSHSDVTSSELRTSPVETGLVAWRPAKGAGVTYAALSGHVYRRDFLRSRKAGSKTVAIKMGVVRRARNVPQIYLKKVDGGY